MGLGVIGLGRADQGGMEARWVGSGSGGGGSNLIDADLRSGQRSRWNYRTRPPDILIRTPSFALSLSILVHRFSNSRQHNIRE